LTSVHVDTARTWRGGQHQVFLTVTGLCELGHPAVLVAQASGELARRAKEGLRTMALNPSGEFDVQAGWQLHRLLRSIVPDVVHLHDPMGIALMAMMVVRPEGILPSKIARRELHTVEELIEIESSEPGATADTADTAEARS